MNVWPKSPLWPKWCLRDNVICCIALVRKCTSLKMIYVLNIHLTHQMACSWHSFCLHLHTPQSNVKLKTIKVLNFLHNFILFYSYFRSVFQITNRNECVTYLLSVASDQQSSYAAQRKLKVRVLTTNFVTCRQVWISADIRRIQVTGWLPEER